MANRKQPSTADAAIPDFNAFWGEKLRPSSVICLLLALATIAVFWPVARLDFVNYDDPDYVTSNLHVQSGLTWQSTAWAFTSGHASNWHPLTWLSHMLDWQLFNKNAGGHHLVSLAFHIANTLLLFLVLRRMTGAHWRSAVVAALFALHPLHVESVAWVSERKDVLSTLFFLLCLGAYARYVEVLDGDRNPACAGQPPELRGPRPEARASKPKVRNRNADDQSQKANLSGSRLTQPSAGLLPLSPLSSRPAFVFYCLALLFFALGLMSKPMLVTLPFVLLLLDGWPLHRFRPGTPGSNLRTMVRLVAEKVPFIALSLTSSVITLIVQQRGGAVSTILTLGARVANALVSYARYIGKMFWPAKLSVLYPHPGHWPAWQVTASAALVVAISAGAVWGSRRRPYCAVGWLWFVGGLVPVIGLVQVGVQSMADRYTYVPLIGLFIVLVWGISEWVPLGRWRTPTLAWGAALALVVCASLTSRQVQFWRDSLSLFGHAVEVTSNNYLAYHNIGFYLYGQGKTDEAMVNYLKALEINPAYEDALNNMGYALAAQHKYAEAIGYYERALRVRPNHADVHNNLGNALADLGRSEEAIEHYRRALDANPEHPDAHNNLGIALAALGKIDAAIDQFHDALRFKPNNAGAHSNLGNALAAKRDFEGAVKEYQESLRLNPDDAQAHNNLGNVLSELRKLDEAIPHYTQALRLNTNNPEAHFNLGTALARQGRTAEAIGQYNEALRLKPDYAEARRQLNTLSQGGAPPP
jgi:protein O-mannosyl-transferase